MYYTNYGMDFALYCISGQNFRKAAKTLLCKSRNGRLDTPATGITGKYDRIKKNLNAN